MCCEIKDSNLDFLQEVPFVQDQTDNEYFYSIIFPALDKEWQVSIYVDLSLDLAENSFISFKLFLKSEIHEPLKITYSIGQSPMSNIYINPLLLTFEFNQNTSKTEYHRTQIANSDSDKLLRREDHMYFEIGMFLLK